MPTKQEEAIAAVQNLSGWCNDMGHDADAFVECLTLRTHRTLQQGIASVMFKCIKAWAATEHYDGRNEETVKQCKRIVELMDDPSFGFLPLI